LKGIAASIVRTPKASHQYLASTGLNYLSIVFQVFMSFQPSLNAIFPSKNQMKSLTTDNGFDGGIQSALIIKNPVKKFVEIKNIP
jgi:hypothetical protein